MTNECARMNNVGQDGILPYIQSKLGWYKSFCNIKDQPERTPVKTGLSNCVGGSGVTLTHIAHIHIFDIARDPN